MSVRWTESMVLLIKAGSIRNQLVESQEAFFWSTYTLTKLPKLGFTYSYR